MILIYILLSSEAKSGYVHGMYNFHLNKFSTMSETHQCKYFPQQTQILKMGLSFKNFSCHV